MGPRTEALTTEALYREHWQYVYDLLPAYGVYDQSQEDVAQDVWYTVHLRIGTYDPSQGVPRAWITGIVRNCAANHRRRRRRENVGLEDDLLEAAIAQRASAAELATRSLRGRGPLNPEEKALVFWMLRKALENDEQFEAFVLHYFYGRSYAEIATAQGINERAVEHRIIMAKKRLRRDDDTPSGAFLGFGSLEALQDAMRSPGQPSSRGAELWRRVSAQIGAGSLPAPGIPGSAPGVLLSKPLLAGLLAVAFLCGAGAGAGGVLLLQRMSAARVTAAHVVPDSISTVSAASAALPAPAESLASVPRPVEEACQQKDALRVTVSPTRAAAVVVATPSKPAPPRPGLKHRSATSGGEASTEVKPQEADDAAMQSSMLLILQMRAAARSGQCATVLTLADEHAREYPRLDISAREAERARCR